MSSAPVEIILASGSPRRKEILENMNLRFEIETADIDETPLDDETAKELAERLAREKGEKVAERRPDKLVISADTIVSLNGNLLGKPLNRDNAREMLENLSGKKHEVVTGISFILKNEGTAETFLSLTELEFKELSPEAIDGYLNTGEYEGKAGAYAIQGHGRELIKSFNGSYSNVVGFPVSEFLKFGKNFGLKRLPWR